MILWFGFGDLRLHLQPSSTCQRQKTQALLMGDTDGFPSLSILSPRVKSNLEEGSPDRAGQHTACISVAHIVFDF